MNKKTAGFIMTTGIVGLLLSGCMAATENTTETPQAENSQKNETITTADTENIFAKIKSNDIDAIYHGTDAKFKTTLLGLKTSFPILNSYVSVKIDKTTESDKTGTVSGKLIDNQNTEFGFTLELSKENTGWDIVSLGIKQDPASEKDLAAGREDSTATIEQVIVGETVGNDGSVVANNGPFPASTEAIRFSIVTKQNSEKMGATIKLIYNEDDTGLETSALLDKKTDGTPATTYLEFTKPTNNWPSGNYKAVASLANGQTKDVTFQVK